MAQVLPFAMSYFDHASGGSRPVPVGTPVQVTCVGYLITPVVVTVTVAGQFPGATVPAGSAGAMAKGARVAVINLRGSSEYQIHPIV